VQPTAEQQQAIALFRTDGSLKINAFAGSGKTTTLTLLSRTTTRPGIYLAFNRSIAHEAATKFPRTVECRTTHSLAFRTTPSEFKRTTGKMTDRLFGNAIAQILELHDLVLSNEFSLSARSFGALIGETVRRFQHSDARTIETRHVPRWGKMAALSRPALALLLKETVERARELWAKMIDPSDATPMGHDGYLKLWSLGRPQIPADYVLLDEAQDSNPAVLSVLTEQSSQVVYVGDRYQQIYEWRGAVNAMDRIDTRHETSLTQSFRFGSAIAEAATKVLRALGEKQAIQGNPKVASRLGKVEADAVLCRTNANVIDEVLRALGEGGAPCVVGGTSDALRLLEGVSRLKRGQSTDVPEFFGFSSWRDVVAFSESDEGEQLRTFVRLVERHGDGALRDCLNKVIDDEQAASIVISTAHKAKGREWEQVRLTDDFTLKRKDKDGKETLDEEEVRLFYVALTRAKLGVAVPPKLAGIFGIVQPDLLSDRPIAESNPRSPPFSRPATSRPPRPSRPSAAARPPGAPHTLPETLESPGRVGRDSTQRTEPDILRRFFDWLRRS
jgi:hypothetical protein